ncbi:MAG: hypothetical protein PVH19_12505 [Planctomycetia bacterium]|jgi:hypothetical protein
MFRKTTILITLTALATLNAASVLAISPESFFCSRAIEFEEIDQGTLVVVPIEEDMYRMLQPTFPDLFVFDDQGNPTAGVVLRRPKQEKEWQLPPEAIEIYVDKKKGETIVKLDVGKRPISRLEFQTPDRNFQRYATVNVLTDKRDWSKVKDGQISRIDLEGVEQEQLAMTFPEQLVSEMKVEIHNGENRPIEIEKVRLFGPTHECRFIAEPGRHYTMEYGSTSKKFAPLDTAALDVAQRNGLTPVAGQLSDQVLQRKEIVEEESGFSEFFRNPWTIYPAIVVLILLIGGGLFFAARRMEDDKTEKEDEKDAEKKDTTET